FDPDWFTRLEPQFEFGVSEFDEEREACRAVGRQEVNQLRTLATAPRGGETVGDGLERHPVVVPEVLQVTESARHRSVLHGVTGQLSRSRSRMPRTRS